MLQVLKITVANPDLHRNGVVTGSVRVETAISVPELLVEFVSIDSPLAGDLDGAETVLSSFVLSAAADLEAGQQFTFSLDVPSYLIRDYKIAGAQRTLEVRTKAGRRKKGTRDRVEVHLPPPQDIDDHHLEGLRQELEQDAAVMPRYEWWAGVAMIALGIATLVWGVAGGYIPAPENDEGSDLLLIGFAAFCICGGAFIVWMKRSHAETFEVLDFQLAKPFEAPGTPVEVRILNTSDDTFDIAFEGLARWMNVSRHQHQSAENMHTFGTVWSTVAPGVNLLVFELPVSSAPSHHSPGVGVDYYLRVVRAGRRNSKVTVATWKHRVLVS